MGSGAYPPSYSVDNGSPFGRETVVWARGWPLSAGVTGRWFIPHKITYVVE